MFGKLLEPKYASSGAITFWKKNFKKNYLKKKKEEEEEEDII